jgi:hypothetical protein
MQIKDYSFLEIFLIFVICIITLSILFPRHYGYDETKYLKEGDVIQCVSGYKVIEDNEGMIYDIEDFWGKRIPCVNNDGIVRQ